MAPVALDRSARRLRPWKQGDRGWPMITYRDRAPVLFLDEDWHRLAEALRALGL